MRQLFRDPEGELPSERRAAVFGLTWLAYATYYLGRKGFAVAKSRIADEQGLSLLALGNIDTGYLSAYAVGQLLSGIAGDRLGARRLVGFGMLASAAACLLCGVSSVSSAGWLLAAAFALNGLFQATGWPGTVKAMAEWFRSAERGAVMGIWTTNYQVGGLVATALATFLLTHWGWRTAFTVPAAALALVGGLILLALPERGAESEQGNTPLVRSRDILRMPVVWSIGAAYFGLKLIRYSILFWLPFYLRKELGYSESAAGYLSISFEVGGIAGAIVVGLISDRYFRDRRRLLASRMIALLAVALLLYTRLAGLGPVANFAGMALVGFCLFGPDALISGAAAQDVGGAAAAATAAGVINGLGSVGAILQGWVTAGLSQALGWSALFYVFVALALASAFALRVAGPQVARATA